MRAVLDRDSGLRTGKTICQIVLMELPALERRFLMTDTGITIRPTLDQKRELLQQVADTAVELGCEQPRIALMAASEKVADSMPETRDAEQLAQLGADGVFGDCRVQGPLSFDLAFASQAADTKNIAGEVAGAADAMVFPDLLSANLTVKAIMYTAPSRFGGILAGVSCPVAFMSRADNVETRLNSLVFGLHLLEHAAQPASTR